MARRLKRATCQYQIDAKLPTLTHPEQTMNSFPTPTLHSSADFVSTDTAALASHMDHCAIKRSRFFGVQAALELARSVILSRMVTAVVVAVVLLAVTGIV